MLNFDPRGCATAAWTREEIGWAEISFRDRFAAQLAAIHAQVEVIDIAHVQRGHNYIDHNYIGDKGRWGRRARLRSRSTAADRQERRYQRPHCRLLRFGDTRCDRGWARELYSC